MSVVSKEGGRRNATEEAKERGVGTWAVNPALPEMEGAPEQFASAGAGRGGGEGKEGGWGDDGGMDKVAAMLQAQVSQGCSHAAGTGECVGCFSGGGGGV